MTIKEHWNDVDKTCETCGQVTQRVKGITKQNMKRLIIPKWNMNEFLITFLMLMLIVLALLYKHDTQLSRDWIKGMDPQDLDKCIQHSTEKCNLLNTNLKDLPYPNITNYTQDFNLIYPGG